MESFVQGERKMIKSIFLDFDGTVSDAHRIAYKSIVRALEDFGYEFDKDLLFDLMGEKIKEIFIGLGLNLSNLSVVRCRFYKYFTEGALSGGIKLCVSVNPLWELKKDYPLVVISNSETSFIKASIRKLGLNGLFKKVYGAEKFSSKDEFLKELFKEFKIKPSEAIYIGDRFSDVRYARKAGCVGVAISNKCSWSDLKTLKKEKPDYIIKDFRGLKRILRKESFCKGV
ncbi:HAD family hydrolase [Candidatus Pacearchaeota archaeon]|nr:HAD family hydrolase [Candidatus Pacearchaeota archaeon]